MYTSTVLAFAKIIAREFRRLPPLERSTFYLQPTPPLRRLKHACDTDAPGTNPAAVAVPALVSIFIWRVPWVSWFPSMANHVPRWGRQALLLDSGE